MQTLLIITIAVHVLSSVFWAGSAFVLARSGGRGGAALFRPQIAAASLSILSGLPLGHLLHQGSFELAEKVLATGAVAALLAFVIQLTMVRSALKSADAAQRLAAAYRACAVLLAVTVICMAISRFV